MFDLGKHYKQAGAVNLYGKKYNLPTAFSYHGSFYMWAPEGEMPETVIAFSEGNNRISFFNTYFENVELAKKIYNPYSMKLMNFGKQFLFVETQNRILMK